MKKKVLVSSVLVIALCLSIIVGSTFALFTSKTQLNVAVTAGNVKVVATLQENSLKAYSGQWNYETDVYDSVEVSANSALSKVFANGGTVVADTAKNEIKIDKITPLDKIAFIIDVTNYSDVNIKYRTVITTDAVATSDGVTLLDALEITIDDADTMGQVDANTKASTWANWAPAADVAAGETKSIKVVIEFPNGTPDHDNLFQDLAASLTYTVEAVQGNGYTVDDISSILAAAPAGSTVELPAENYGTMTIANTLNNVTIDFANVESVDEIIIAAGAKLDNVTFKNLTAGTDEVGDGYQDAIVKVMAGAEADIIIDEANFTNTKGGKIAAINSREGNASITVTNSTFTGFAYAYYSNSCTIADLSFENCEFVDFTSWVVQNNKGTFDGNVSIAGCTFKNCVDGIAKLGNSGTIGAGYTFTFVNNTVDAASRGHDGSDAKWFTVDAATNAATLTVSGNTKGGSDWTPDATNGLK